MEDRDPDNFSWPGLFIVTACCSFIFNIMVKVLDGYFSTLLYSIAVISSVAAIVSLLIKWLLHRYDKKRNRRLLS